MATGNEKLVQRNCRWQGHLIQRLIWRKVLPVDKNRKDSEWLKNCGQGEK